MAFWRGCNFLSIGSKKQQIARYGTGTQARVFNAKPEDCTPNLQRLHAQFMTKVKEGTAIPLELIRDIFQQSESCEDASLAFKLLQKHRIYRSSKHHIIENFNEYISSLVIAMSIRTKQYDLGLQVLWRHNVYGFSPSLRVAHELLNYAREAKDLEVMKNVFKTIIKNPELLPNSQTADLMIRTCKGLDNFDLMMKIMEEFRENEISLSPTSFDIIISSAANNGCAEDVFKIQGWREEAGLEYTVASIFALAKAHLLNGNPEAAADLVSVHCKEMSKANGYVLKLVNLWPKLLSSKKEEFQQDSSMLKEAIKTFTDLLAKRHPSLWVNVDEDFVTGDAQSERG